MSSSNSLRRFFSMPLVAFDWVRIGMHNNPKSGNYTMMMASFAAIFVIGNGADKFTTSNNIAGTYDRLRRLNRYYVPYFLADYSYKFPQIGQQ